MAQDTTHGTDVIVYVVTKTNKAGDTGPQVSLLGQWENISIVHTKIWSEVTSSDAPEPEKKKRMDSYKATLKNFVRDSVGSIAFEASTTVDYVYAFFQTAGGQTMQFRGGIMEASLDGGAEAWKDSLQLESTGMVGGVPSLTYVG